jgi:excisionase family DNA binding protein
VQFGLPARLQSVRDIFVKNSARRQNRRSHFVERIRSDKIGFPFLSHVGVHALAHSDASDASPKREDEMDTPIAYTIAEACAVARAGRTAIYEAIRNGALQARKRGRRTLILADDLRRWVESLPTLEPKS